jgi:dolichol-phosphate mannosyltransferase
MTTPVFSVVIPVKDEAANIRHLIEEIRAACDKLGDYEIIVVNDGSTDNTLEVLRDLKRQSSPSAPLIIVKNPHNLGQSTSLLMGVRQARSPWIVTLDGDGQNDPADIPALLQRATAQPDVGLIAGQRVKRRDSLNKRLASRAANFIRARLLQDGTPDTGCGLKLIRRDLFLSLPYFNHMHRYLPALVRRHGGIVELVPVNHRHRTQGTSKYGTLDRLWVGIWDLMGVMWLLRRNRLPATTPTVE